MPYWEGKSNGQLVAELLSQLKQQFPAIFAKWQAGTLWLGSDVWNWVFVTDLNQLARWSYPELESFVIEKFPQLRQQRKELIVPTYTESEATAKGRTLGLAFKAVFSVRSDVAVVQAMSLGWEFAKWNGFSDPDNLRAFATGFGSVFDNASNVLQLEQDIRNG